jgi:fructokinase
MQIGIDLGGTKTEAIALASATVVAPRRRIPTPPGYAATLDAIAGLVAELESEIGPAGTVGVGIPGVVTQATGLVKNANSTWLIGRPLQADLEALLARPVRVANDANCFTLSEAIDGAGRGFETVFGVISAPASAEASRSGSASTRVPTRSRASGATTSSPG